MKVMLVLISVGQTTSAQHYVVLPSQLIPRDTVRDSVGLTNMPQQQSQSQMPSQAYANYAMGPLQASFSFRVESPTNSSIVVCYDYCFMLSDAHVAAMFPNGSSIIGVCGATTLQSIPLAGICASLLWYVDHTRSALSGCSSYCCK